MDLTGLDGSDGYESYHLNWTGWGIIGDLLHELECDLTLMAGSNDGDEVDADTARAWGTAILTAVKDGRLYCLYYQDPSYSGGERMELHAEGTTTPVYLSGDAIVRALLHAEEDKACLSTPPRRESVVTGDDHWNWLVEVGEFFTHSGGFQQW